MFSWRRRKWVVLSEESGGERPICMLPPAIEQRREPDSASKPQSRARLFNVRTVDALKPAAEQLLHREAGQHLQQLERRLGAGHRRRRVGAGTVSARPQSATSLRSYRTPRERWGECAPRGGGDAHARVLAVGDLLQRSQRAGEEADSVCAVPRADDACHRPIGDRWADGLARWWHDGFGDGPWARGGRRQGLGDAEGTAETRRIPVRVAAPTVARSGAGYVRLPRP